MGKKRGRTMDEKLIHDKAIKIRKKEDKELIEYIENRVEKARSEGFNEGVAKGKTIKADKIAEALNEIGKIKGIGIARCDLIQDILTKQLT